MSTTSLRTIHPNHSATCAAHGAHAQLIWLGTRSVVAPQYSGPTPHELMHGPLSGHGTDEAALKKRGEVMAELGDATRNGQAHLLWMKYQREAAAADGTDDALSINFCVPRLMAGVQSEYTEGGVYLTDVVILADQDDCERIAATHIQKSPNFTPILFESLIATTDNKVVAREGSEGR